MARSASSIPKVMEIDSLCVARPEKDGKRYVRLDQLFSSQLNNPDTYMKRIKLLLILTLSVLAVRNHAQTKITRVRNVTANAVQYELAEWQVDLQAAFQNPFLQEEITLDMLITSPAGKTLVLPCFFDSGAPEASVWRARFLPQEKGKYRCSFRLRTPKGTHESEAMVFVVKRGSGKGILHANNQWTFRYDNGEHYRGLGENLCWESRDNDDSKFFKALHENKKYNYEYMLPSLAKHSGDYFRTWICSWNLPIDWKSGFNNSRYTPSDAYFNPSAVRKLDRLVRLSDSLKLHMMLTLGAGTHTNKHGRYEVDMHRFFTDEQAKAQYRNRLRFIVARWGYSPSIGAWEFFNEIDNIQFRDQNNPIPAADIVRWHDEMSAYLATIDPYEHLITTSISHRDLDGLNNLKYIDFNQKHIYRNNRALPTTIVDYGKRFSKPYVIGEYGFEYDWQKNFDLFAAEMDSDFKRGLWYGLFSPTPVLPLSWWWEYFDNRGTDAYLAHVRPVLDAMMKAGRGGFATVEFRNTQPGLEVFAVKCGKKTFVYVYNPGKEVLETKVRFPGSGPVRSAWVYDCERASWSKIHLKKDVSGSLSGIRVAPGEDVVLVF
ncbi:DUF5060 domain-containing protein [Pedobacter sp. SYP-B3415]|uniref:DUF5060 domain-containing protein n=1 Tax=Pedobacter sp. SYP-B3415 TaxID=2496641 RepID=UPI00101DE16E|nr:DUF5060 domain-containing protein [Pedobacter sp. SYP-B3415]